jgi:mannosyl-oligosaccharide alpha-1,2-mannosidase
VLLVAPCWRCRRAKLTEPTPPLALLPTRISEPAGRTPLRAPRDTRECPVNLTADVWLERRDAVRDAFRHAWHGYVRHAFGYDEYHPISRRGSNMYDGNGIGFTVVDTLDTIIIMGLEDEYAHARRWIVQKLSFDQEVSVNLFETSIRVLGGLLSSHYLTSKRAPLGIPLSRRVGVVARKAGDALYKNLARDLGNRLFGAFWDQSPIPTASVFLKSRRPEVAHNGDGSSSTSEVSTIQLEYTELSRITGDPIYRTKARDVIKRFREVKPASGLLPIYINPSSGDFQGNTVTLGARGDSYYGK